MRAWLLSLLLLAPAWAQTGLIDLNGRSVTPAELSKEGAVLVVWCTQCASCRSVDEDLEAFYRRWKGKIGFAVVTPHPADSEARVRDFREERGLDFPVLRDPTQTFIGSLGVERTTTTLVFDREGKIRYFGPFAAGAPAATEAVWAGREVSRPRLPQNGCPIPPVQR